MMDSILGILYHVAVGIPTSLGSNVFVYLVALGKSHELVNVVFLAMLILLHRWCSHSLCRSSLKRKVYKF